ncbi:MAG: CRISPR-associated endonuclease Cas1 [Acidimicrobiales bacterium]
MRRRPYSDTQRSHVLREGPPLSVADVADILVELEATYTARQPHDPSVAVVDGHGVSVGVYDGHLRVRDGSGWFRRERSYNRATAGLRRVVVAADSGSLSLAALAWCRRIGVSLVVLDDEGAILAQSPPGSDDARIRRAQARALDGPGGLEIATTLLGAKLAGHAAIARDVIGNSCASDTIDSLAAVLPDAESIDEARQLEASAAAAYWQAWSGHPATSVRFATRDASRVPAHWLRFDSRRSVLASVNSNRRAERPVNAMLNYCYVLAGLEAGMAAVAIGLDPGLGIVHLDAPGRASLTLDLLEPVRPAVERFVLAFIGRRVFRRADFAEAPDGYCQLLPPLTHELAEAMPAFAREVAPWAEHVVHLLGKGIEGKFKARTPLTGANHRAAQARVRARKAASAVASASARQVPVAKQRSMDHPDLPLTRRCVECGDALSRDRHQRCPSCWAVQPGQDEATRRRRGQAIAAARAELERWRIDHPDAVADPEQFAEAILPGLATVKLRAIIEACGVSKSTASMIRSGRHVPAVRHWRALAKLANAGSQRDGPRTAVPAPSTRAARPSNESDSLRRDDQ